MRLFCWAVPAAVFAAAAFLGSPSVQAAGYTDTVENTPGLLAYYQFSGNTNSSVNAYTGTLTTGASLDASGSGPTLPDDPTNAALKLDGTSGNELQSSLTGGISSSGSVVAWINLATLPTTAGRYFYIAGESAGGDDFDLQIQPDSATANVLHFYTESGGNVSYTLDPSILGQWVMVAGTFTSGSDRSIYVNGVQVATNVPGGHNANSSAFTIGYSNVFGGRSFQGDIDEVAVFDTDLTSNQMAAIYDSAVPEPASLALLGLAIPMILKRRR